MLAVVRWCGCYRIAIEIVEEDSTYYVRIDQAHVASFKCAIGFETVVDLAVDHPERESHLGRCHTYTAQREAAYHFGHHALKSWSLELRGVHFDGTAPKHRVPNVDNSC